jgi:hypothetical protein
LRNFKSHLRCFFFICFRPGILPLFEESAIHRSTRSQYNQNVKGTLVTDGSGRARTLFTALTTLGPSI